MINKINDLRAGKVYETLLKLQKGESPSAETLRLSIYQSHAVTGEHEKGGKRCCSVYCLRLLQYVFS